MHSFFSKRTMVATILICIFLLYITFTFNSCLMPSIRRSLQKNNVYENDEPKKKTTSSNCSEVLEIRLVDTVVRNVPLTGLNDGENTSKYRLLSEHGERLNRHLPKVLIIGIKKSGTRALLEFIRLHPLVRAAGSEVHFFDRHYQRGLHWYRGRMPTTIDGQITMEKTPSYFITKEVPYRVHHMNPSTKLLIVVRDPVQRAISDYTQAASKRKEMKTFEELAFLNLTAGVVDTNWGPIKIGLYARHLERWIKYFSLSQFLFISGERLISDPAFEIGRVQDFLGLKRIITEKYFYFNSSKGFPCLIKSESRSTPHCLGKSKGRSHPSISSSAYKHLKEFYRPYNLKFYQMTGIDFGWP